MKGFLKNILRIIKCNFNSSLSFFFYSVEWDINLSIFIRLFLSPFFCFSIFKVLKPYLYVIIRFVIVICKPDFGQIIVFSVRLIFNCREDSDINRVTYLEITGIKNTGSSFYIQLVYPLM